MQDRLTPQIVEFVRAKRAAAQHPEEEKYVTVNEAVGAIAFYYEKIRGIVEYRDDHLVRQHAIKRILGRRLILTESTGKIALGLLRELVRSRYLLNNHIPESKAQEIQNILDQYLAIIENLRARKILTDKDEDWLFFMASCAIDEALVSMKEEEAMVHMMYQFIAPNFTLASVQVDPKTENLQKYIATYRVLLKPDIHRLRYFILKQTYAHWTTYSTSPDQLAREYSEIKKKIDEKIKHPYNRKLLITLRKYRIPFVIILTILQNNSVHILKDPDALEAEVRRICEGLYNVQRRRLTTRAIRAFIYVFITKIILGLVIELPYDLLAVGHIQVLPLLINMFVPPALLATIALTAKFPGSDNTDRIVQAINEAIYNDTPKEVFIPQLIGKKKKSTTTRIIFPLLYIIVFGASFSMLAWILHKLHFNIVSAGIFFMFICLMTFFGVTLRRSAKELRMVREKATLAVAFIDPFILPIVQVGRWLSFNISRVNIFVFIFDILIELPLQAALEVVEEWFAFMKEKREEEVD